MRKILFVLLGCGAAAACGDDADTVPQSRTFTIEFAGEVNGQSAQCGATYDGVGTPGGSYTLGDFRFYVHDVRLLEAGTGAEVPMTLDDAGVWQDGTVALLDFEDGCAGGTAQTNSVVVGTAPEGVYDGLRFVLGVPFASNHQDAAVAASPLNVTAMFWNWNGGYKFARIDGNTDGNAFRFHLGSTGCEMDTGGTVTTCANPNRVQVSLTDFDPDSMTVVADHGRLLALTDTSTSVNAVQPGCQSNPADEDCITIFDRLGLPFGGNAPSGNQVLFDAR